MYGLGTECGCVRVCVESMCNTIVFPLQVSLNNSIEIHTVVVSVRLVY